MTATTTADSVILVIPTYNESANIAPLVENISQAINGYDYEILFVDDNSSDGTAGIARQMADRYPVRVIVRTDEKGLASAVVRALKTPASS
jgi:dolichol-phosphate mannosyltransferase